MIEFEMTGRVGRDLRPDDVRIVAAREMNLRGNAVINVIDPTKSYQPTFPNADATCVIAKRSIDARNDVIYRYRIEGYNHRFESYVPYEIPEYKDVTDADPVFIIGAGTFSDGKLFTRSSKRGDIREVLYQFVNFGASPQILVDAHPHIGTDRLPKVVENIRQCIESRGGEYHFGTKVTDMTRNEDGTIEVSALDSENLTKTGKPSVRKYSAKKVILATGHSARDIYEMLVAKDCALEAKGFAMGVRVEHPQALINDIRYHGQWEPGMPAAEYSFTEQVNDRGVFSFCMCPGGVLVPSETEPETIVMNGMSNSARSGKFANAGVVVQINPEDIPEEYTDKGAFAGLEFQKDVERKMWEYAHEHSDSENPFVAPAQRMVDFCEGEDSEDLPETSYKPGVVPAPLHEILPPFIAERLQDAFAIVNQKSMRGYYTNDALLIGVESRTSSPVRIPRNPRNCEADSFPGLLPCGEGAGYSGGIVSSAIDGINCAVAAARSLSGADVEDEPHEGTAGETSEAE